jgi:hypothetical protein
LSTAIRMSKENHRAAYRLLSVAIDNVMASTMKGAHMPNEHELADQKRVVQAALLKRMGELIEEADGPVLTGMVEDLSLAYRHLAGGSQPGASVISK